MTFNYQQALEVCLAQQSSPIAQHILENGEIVWVRQAAKHNSIWRYRLLGFIAKIFHLGVLTPVPSLGGERAIANEAQALTRLAQYPSIHTPRLLAQQRHALMMSSLNPDGITLMQLLERSNPEAAYQYWQQGIAAIANVHHHHTHLSQCFARNMIVINRDTIGFIDFEDAPETVLSLQECQTRDWLCYLHSSALLLEKRAQTAQAAAALVQVISKETYQSLIRTLRILKPLKHIHHTRWGNDTLRLAALARLYQILSQQASH